jgi:hypothetical protein
VVHAYRNVGDVPGLVFNAPNRLYVGWGKIQLEEGQISKPIRLPLHRLDLAVGRFHRTARDHHVVVRQQARAVGRQHLGHLLNALIPEASARRIQPSRNVVAKLFPGCFQNRSKFSFI